MNKKFLIIVLFFLIVILVQASQATDWSEACTGSCGTAKCHDGGTFPKSCSISNCWDGINGSCSGTPSTCPARAHASVVSSCSCDYDLGCMTCVSTKCKATVNCVAFGPCSYTCYTNPIAWHNIDGNNANGCENSEPNLTAVSDAPDPVNVGSAVTFTGTAGNGGDSEAIKMYVCKTAAATSSGCTVASWCTNTTAGVTSNPTCQYTAQSGDVGTNSYYIYIYDASNYAAPNNGLSGTFTVSSAAVSAVITITLNYPNDDVWNTTTRTITHYYTPVITGTSANYLNCTLYTNYTGTWGSVAGNATPITNNTVNSIQYAYAADNANVKWNIYCWNASGSPSNYSSANKTIKIDITSPATTATPIKNDSASYSWNTWTNSTYVNVSLSCSDATSGCQVTKYCNDSSNSCTPSTTYTSGYIQLNVEGTSYIRWNSTDNAGNTEAINSQIIKIDTTAPTTTATAVKNDSVTYTFGTWTNSTYVNVTLSCSDGSGSGCQSQMPKYCNDTSNSCTPSTDYSNPVQISTEGTSYIRYNSTDAVGKSEAVKSQTINIDTTPPSQVTNLINSSTGTTWVNISWDASTDSASGVLKYLVWRNGTNVYNTTTNATLYYNNSGLTAGASYSYIVGAIDNSSNYGQNSSTLTVTLFNISTNLGQSATPASPQQSGTNVTFMCNYSLASDGSPITSATVYLNLNSLNFSTTYSNGNYTYWNDSMTSGNNAWYCIASKATYDSQTGAQQTYMIAAATALTTDATSYPNCGAVSYRISLYNANSQLTSSSFSLTFLYPNSTNATPPLSLYPNNGTGIYIGSYALNSTYPVGTWLLKVIENLGVTAAKNFYVAAAS